MIFKEWFKENENEFDLYNCPVEAMEMAWDKARKDAFKEAEEMGEVNLFALNREQS